jgi:23S rRNA (uracil-5-)-methyltransferase RumA
LRENAVIELSIDDFAFPNAGLGSFEGKTARVKNALPGQVVEARVKKTRRVIEAELRRVIKRAENETAPGCPAFGLCGGCAFLTLPYEDEAKLKACAAEAVFAKAGLSGFDYEGFCPARSPARYRNKMEFAFGDDGPGGELTLGMRKRGSFYETVNADSCLLCHEDFGLIAKAAREFFAGTGKKFYHRAKKTGELRHLVIRKSEATEEILINLVTSLNAAVDFDRLIEAVKEAPLDGTVVSVWHTRSDSVADVIKPDGAALIYGKPFFEERLSGLSFSIGPFSFFQTNTRGAAALFETALEFAAPALNGARVYDLYCGTGTLAQLCAKKCKTGRTTGVEIVAEAVKAAEDNAARNGITNCSFIAGDVLKELDGLSGAPDVIFTDPPRDGVHPKALPKIIAAGAPVIVYISCNPVTLARDAAVLTESGYSFSRLKFHDMFPRAAHVECAALFEKK